MGLGRKTTEVTCHYHPIMSRAYTTVDVDPAHLADVVFARFLCSKVSTPAFYTTVFGKKSLQQLTLKEWFLFLTVLCLLLSLSVFPFIVVPEAIGTDWRWSRTRAREREKRSFFQISPPPLSFAFSSSLFCGSLRSAMPKIQSEKNPVLDTTLLCSSAISESYGEKGNDRIYSVVICHFHSWPLHLRSLEKIKCFSESFLTV